MTRGTPLVLYTPYWSGVVPLVTLVIKVVGAVVLVQGRSVLQVQLL